MATFVLVHGAWAGAHGWRHVRKLLTAGGHAVFTPSLTGIGERVHLASPQVDLTTHVNDVVNHIVFEDLRDVVLVGYSYGGVVVTGAVEHVHDRVRELVFLDAFVPSHGESAFDALRVTGPELIGVGTDWLVPPPAREYDDPAEADWHRPRRVAHPIRCFTETVRLSQPLEEHRFGLTYIKATAEPSDTPGGAAFWEAGKRAQASSRWRYSEIDTNHMVPSNRPDELARLLTEIALSSH
jgi:pimeloyl-ACP methyl ester carboxylesterase